MDIYKSIALKLKNVRKNQIEEVFSNTDNPVTLSYISKFKNKPITVPVWTYIYENKFYLFAGKKSKKVESIEDGNVDISLLIINNEFYPHPESESISYIGISGEAKIVYYKENPDIKTIHQKLLQKYDKNLSQSWIKDLYDKIENDPTVVWLIEINPISFYSY